MEPGLEANTSHFHVHSHTISVFGNGEWKSELIHLLPYAAKLYSQQEGTREVLRNSDHLENLKRT